MYRDPSKKSAQSMLTNRQTKTIKSLEETYGVKYLTPPSKSTMKPPLKTTVPIGITLKDRGDMEFNDTMSSFRHQGNRYVITASDRYDKAMPTARRRGVTFNPSSDSASLLEERRAEVLSKQQQYFSKVEKPVSARQSATTKVPKTARPVREGTDADLRRMHQENYARSRCVGSENDVERMRHESNRHAQYKSEPRPKDTANDDKDDTEEFIVLIKREIEKSVSKSISEMMKNSLAEMNAKVDRQAADIKKIGALVQKINTNLSSKITHYGEENSRHFRYLCMKSEYDKMFYQHQTQVSATKPPEPPILPSSTGNDSNESTITQQMSQPQPSARTLVPDHAELPKTSVDDMRGMVAQLKKLCLDYESKVILDEGDTSSSSMKSGNGYETIQHRAFRDDEANASSDGMTPRSFDNAGPSFKRSARSSSKPSEKNLFKASLAGAGDD